MFHVSMLEPAIPNTFQQHSEPLPASVIINGEPEDTDDSEWLPATELEHAKELVNDFHLKYPTKPEPL